MTIIVTIIPAMTMTRVQVAEAKAKLSQIISSVHQTRDRVIITKNGVPAAVLISPDDLESLEETLAIQSDRSLMAEIAAGQAELKAGLGVRLDRPPERGSCPTR
jgi:prevent-host-death family protein